MYKITKEQIVVIKKAFFDVNAPVQMYNAVVMLLDQLPELDNKVGGDKIKETK